MLPTDSSPAISLDPSPSFNTYSSATLAQIADRVVRELSTENNDPNNHNHNHKLDFEDYDENRLLGRIESKNNKVVDDDVDEDKDDDDFEFAFTFGERDSDSSLISADDVFCNGQIRPVYPLFNTDLLLEANIEDSTKPPVPRPVRQPLRKLFIEERETPSCSSSEADELEGIQPETYCVWRPESKDGKCKKSNSTGANSKRWKFRGLLHRTNSDGKEEVVEKWNKDDKEGDRRRSYKQDLVGLFANVGGLSRNIHPF